MTPDRLKACLDAIRWTQRELSFALDVNERTVRRWAAGQNPVPERVAQWLETLARCHEVNPAPRVIDHGGGLPGANFAGDPPA